MTSNDSAIHPRSIAVSGTGLAAAAVLCFSFSFPATVWGLSGFGPWALTGLRGVLAATLAAGCLAACRVPMPKRADWPALLVVAGGCVVGFPLLTALALQTSSAAHSAVVIGLLPLATAVAAALRPGAARLPRAFWWAALAGAAVVVGFALQQDSGRPSVADLYLFAALLVCAAGYAEGGRLARRMPGWQVIGWSLVIAFPVMLAIASMALVTEPVRLTGHAVAGLVYLGAISQFGGFVVWYRGMAEIGVPRASQLQLAQPLLTLVWAALVLGEHLPPAAPAAAVAVACCIAVTQRVRRLRVLLALAVLLAEGGDAFDAAAGPAGPQPGPAAVADRVQAGQPGTPRQQFCGPAVAANGDDRADPAAGQREPLPRAVRGGIA